MTVLAVSPEVRRLGVPALGMLFADVDQRNVDLDGLVRAALDAVAGRDADADPALRGYRELHALVGARARDVASPEALRRMAAKRGAIPTIGPLVDIYNAVSLRTGVAFGAHDATAVDGQVSLRMTDGGESFTPLGADGPSTVRAGEYAYVDEARDVLCRLEVRQGEKTKVLPATTACLVIAQGNPALPADAVERAASEVAELLARHTGARLVARDAAQPTGGR
jgi:DNA/RNA-binding domain of Phe-tRNA-synthetase-like protein